MIAAGDSKPNGTTLSQRERESEVGREGEGMWKLSTYSWELPCWVANVHVGDSYSALYPTNNAATAVSGLLVKSLDGGDTWQAPAIIGQWVSIVWWV